MNMKKLIIFFFLIPSLNRGHCQVATPSLIFILAGQSNMAGRGGVTDGKWDRYVPPESRPGPSVLRLDAELRWREAREPLHADIDVTKTCGVGPGLPFANAVGPARVIGLVPCAVGGTRIEEWARGAERYREMVRRAKAASMATIGGLLWYQGESDTVSVGDAESYKGRMEQLVRDVREDLGDPELLIVQVALASGEGKYIDTVREAQKAITIPNVLCVDAKGLPLEDDHLHLTTQAQVQLGQMLATAYLNRSSLVYANSATR